MDFILKVTLRDTFNPAITRTLSVPAETTFLTLHHALQIAFDWDSSHLYAFRFETPTKYSQTLLEIVDAVSAEHGMGFNEQRVDAQVSLGDILADPTFAGVNYVNKLVYEYDFGDSWEHLVKIQGRTEPKAHIDGPRSTTVEELQAGNWEDLKEAFAAEKPDGYQRERLEWFAESCDGGLSKKELVEWDQDGINSRLAMLGN